MPIEDSVNITFSYYWKWNTFDKLAYQAQNGISGYIKKVIEDRLVYLTDKIISIIKNHFYQSLKSSLEPKIQNKQNEQATDGIILVLTAAKDENNAFKMDQQVSANIENQAGFKLVFKTIHKIEDIGLEIAQNKPTEIRAVWLRAHGKPHTITFPVGSLLRSSPTARVLILC